MERDFNINRRNGNIIISKYDESISIFQTSDDDIWFGTNKDESSITIRLASREYPEWQTYLVFENLIKRIIGKYILEDYQDDYYPSLPKDFINLETKTIVWHSDSGTDNVLTLQYSNRRITITITKAKDAKDHTTNVIRIRTSGSEYETFYQEFTKFYHQISILERELNKTLDPTPSSPKSLTLNPNKKN